MEKIKVSICIPVTRMDGLKKCIDAIKKNAGINVCDYEILWEEDKKRIGCPKMLKKLVAKAKSNMTMFLADDCIPGKDFLKHALEDMEKLPDGWGVVGLKTIDSKSKVLVNYFGHWLADKRMLKYIEGGDFFPLEYRHCYVDCELNDIAKEQGRFIASEKSKILHSHPLHGSCKSDVVYKKAYSKKNKQHDELIYFTRKRARNEEKYGVRLAVGIPLTDLQVYSHFMFSFLALDKPGKIDVLMPNYPGQIDVVRNNLVKQTLAIGCTHIIMMDTDQIYNTKDMFARMLAHKLPVVGAMVHRRYPPFDPLLFRGGIGKMRPVPGSEIDDGMNGVNGGLVEVDATGCGCVLYDTQVFIDLMPEDNGNWFELKVDESGQPVGEDIGFCAKLKQHGYNIFVDCSIKIQHLTLLAVDWGTWRLYKKITGLEDKENGE